MSRKKPSEVTKERKAKSGRDASGQVQSLGRAIRILEVIATADDGLTLTDISNLVGLAPSTAHRLLTTLEHDRFVRFSGDGSIWRIGVGVFAVGNAFVRTRNLVQLARPHMRRLMEESGETVNLGVEDQGEAVFLDQVECRQMMRALVPPGARAAMHCSGVGKALLSTISDHALTKIMEKHGLKQITRRTITKPKDLRNEMARIRKAGYAIDDEEHAVGLRCVAAPIFNEHGEAIAGISLSGPAARITEDRVPILGALVRQVAGDISSAFGGVRLGERMDGAKNT